jgi:hypothetical protein
MSETNSSPSDFPNLLIQNPGAVLLLDPAVSLESVTICIVYQARIALFMTVLA